MTDNTHYVTPQEARDMWCPLAMSLEDSGICTGSSCMAWRWRLMRYEEDKDPEIDAWPAVYSTTHGYCGKVRS